MIVHSEHGVLLMCDTCYARSLSRTAEGWTERVARVTGGGQSEGQVFGGIPVVEHGCPDHPVTPVPADA